LYIVYIWCLWVWNSMLLHVIGDHGIRLTVEG
jgi:hypothetical protein